jgi:hypothetical protein
MEFPKYAVIFVIHKSKLLIFFGGLQVSFGVLFQFNIRHVSVSSLLDRRHTNESNDGICLLR